MSRGKNYMLILPVRVYTTVDMKENNINRITVTGRQKVSRATAPIWRPRMGNAQSSSTATNHQMSG